MLAYAFLALCQGLLGIAYAKPVAVTPAATTEAIGLASEIDESAMMKVDAAQIRTKALEIIRVKVFPHDRQYAPQFADIEKFKVDFASERPCSIYEASVSEAKPTGKFIMRAQALTLDARFLRVPLWIRCSSPFTLTRAEGLRSFRYEGELYVRKDVTPENGIQLLAVNILNLEHYLRGVVPAEVSAAWPMETLKSQAVAARTYAVFHVSYARKTFPTRAYDVDDTIVYQAYTGIDNRHERTDDAVQLTSGQVILYGEHVIQAYYHADSGGVTAPAEQAFQRSVPYCVPKQEHYALDLIKSEWRVTHSLAEIAQKLQARGVLHAATELKDISIPEEGRAPAGRVQQLSLKLANGQTKEISVHEFKRAVSLGSTMFQISALNTEAGPRYEFIGRGSGHGVGMNQLGAKVLAETYSWDYEKILSFYYSGTEICSLESSTHKSCVQGG